MTRVIGLTGGIGSGKSTVAGMFARRGVPVIDTDLIARELVAPGQPALARIAELFGGGILAADGSLDRAAMRRRVFGDDDARRQLEALLHPLIREEAMRRLQTLDTPYCLLVIPLLVENGGWPVIDRVLVVDAPEESRIRRTMQRDGLDEATLRAILAAQCDPASRLAAADDVLVNDGPPEALEAKVETLHRRYLAQEG